jgi:outer membrane protein OmpA-like peptidoglycan-associated protein
VNAANFNPASAETVIVVRAYRPPTATVQAYPAEIVAGEKSTVSAQCQGECGGPLQAPALTASEGSVQGDQFDSTAVQFDSGNTGEQRKTVTITAKCADNRTTGSATTTVTVIRKPVIAAVRLPDVLFSHNNPRVNNCGKRILLEELRGYVEKDPTGRVVLVGHSSTDETAANLDMQRALNAAAVITAGSGVCLAIPQSQVLINATGTNQNGISFESALCGTSVGADASVTGMRRVEVWFIPTGGQLPSYQNAGSLPVSNLGCPK